MVMPRKRRNSKQQPFYAFRDGKVYAANRKARRTAQANKVVVLEGNTLTNNQNADTLNVGEANASNDSESL